VSNSSYQFSVLMPVYAGDDPAHFHAALQSVLQQTRLPDELVVVKDGPLTPALEAVLSELAHPSIRPVLRPQNGGLTAALNTGIAACKYPWIARMDADDICTPDRFEKQMAFLEANPEVSIVGSWIAEYDANMETVFGQRTVPASHTEIARYAQWRCPFNHMTVIYSKAAVTACGLYDDYGAVGDDYVLWVKLIQKGFITANLQEVLVMARGGQAFFNKRRRGFTYFKHELREINYFYQSGFIHLGQWMGHFVVKAFTRLSPAWVVKWIYKLIRK
jgi:glycosyltransferase involved in cell wall biosynthesis